MGEGLTISRDGLENKLTGKLTNQTKLYDSNEAKEVQAANCFATHTEEAARVRC